MRKIVLGLAVTLDGFIEGPNGEFDWCFTDDDYGMNEFLSTIDGVLYGRKSYELMTRFDGGNPFSKHQGYVFTRNKQRPLTDGTTWLEGDAVEHVRALKLKQGKNLWLFGGSELTTSLINAKLVDVLWLSIHPILLGSGKYLFSEIQGPVPLRLLNSKTYPSGLLSVKYEIVNKEG